MADYKNTVFVCDVETGGLPSALKKRAVHEVALTEIAFVVLDNVSLEIVDKKSWLIKPYHSDLIYDPKAAEASNITKEMCEEYGEDIKLVFKEILAMIKKNKRGSKKPILAGQNIIKFDLEFIENLFEYCGQDISKHFDAEVFDTMIWSRYRWPEEGKHNLAVIAERSGLEHTQAHRALPDTIITANIVSQMISNLRGNGCVGEEKKEVRFRETFEI